MSDKPSSLHLVFLQYGNFAAAERALAVGNAETYYGQAYSVGYVQSLLGKGYSVTVINLGADGRDETLPSGVRHVAVQDPYGTTDAQWAALLDDLRIDRLVLRTPLPSALKWLKRRQVPTLATLADSFQYNGIKKWLWTRRLMRLLKQPAIEFIGNHGRNSCGQLVRLGLAPGKVIPWDWPHADDPRNHPVKTGLAHQPPRLLYVGAISEAKGVFDALKGFELFRAQGHEAHFDIVGSGALSQLEAHRAASPFAADITLHGPLPHADVLQRMRKADLVIVPSRHVFPEGLPMTIYEALCARTPLVASDHPMFVGNLVDGQSAILFREKSPAAIAQALAQALDPTTYARLSENAVPAWDHIQIDTKWADLVDAWLRGDALWCKSRSLAPGD